MILIAYKERDAAERSFWGMLKNKGIVMVRLKSIPGAGGAPVEIWLGKKRPKS